MTNIKISEIKKEYPNHEVTKGLVKNSWELREGLSTTVKHYDSLVVVITNNKIKLYNANYSMTTKKLVNTYLPEGMSLVTERGTTYLVDYLDTIKYEYKNNMVIDTNTLEVSYK